MKLELLHEFIVLAKHQNFTNAAKELYLSQPSLSMHLGTLEKELGFKLMDRSNNSVNLTPEGTAFLGYAQKIANTYAEAQAACSEIAADRPSLKVNSIPKDTCYYKTLIDLERPSFTFVDLDLESPLLKMIKRGVVDCGICFDYPQLFGTLDDEKFEGIEFAHIGETKFALCMMDAHPLAGKKELSKADLNGITSVIFSGTHFDDYQQVLYKVLGEDIGLTFHLSPVGSLTNLALVNLGDMIYICAHDSVVTYFSGRDNIVIFDTLDGEEILCPDALAYRAGDKTAAELAEKLKVS